MEPAVVTDIGDGPGLAVGDLEIRIVAAGGDAVADPQLLAAGGRDGACALLVSALVADGGVQVRHLLPPIGDDEIAAGTDFGERRGALDVGGVDGDLPASMEFVEHAGRVLALPHPQTQRGVVRVGEPMHLLQRDDGCGVCPADGVIE